MEFRPAVKRFLPGGMTLSAAMTVLATLLIMIATLLAASAGAQTFSVIHTFTGGSDGAAPQAGLTMDQRGNLYGTTAQGGNLNCNTGAGSGCGVVYKLAPQGSGWVITPLHTFTGGNDGAGPSAGVTFGPDGALYGTTSYGGGSDRCGEGCGTVYSLRPAPTTCATTACPWLETVLHAFHLDLGGDDGITPGGGNVVFDSQGNLYGTTYEGGGYIVGACDEYGCGTVYELSPSGGAWSEQLIFQFSDSATAQPWSGVIFDASGNLYGTTYAGYPGAQVYRLSSVHGSWLEEPLNQLGYNGSEGGVVFDSQGNLYGGTLNGGGGRRGTVFELSPAGENWTYTLLKSFSPPGEGGPAASLIMDAAGNLYGTSNNGALGFGNVFKLTPSNGGWVYTSLYDFTGGSDGRYPASASVLIDANGNLYGTASKGGLTSACSGVGCGVIWKIAP